MAGKRQKGPQLIYESQETWYNQAVKTMNADKMIVQFAFKIENYLKAAEMFEMVEDYLDAAQMAEKCRELAEQTAREEKEYKYQLAIAQKKQASTAKGYEKAEKLLKEVIDYKDVNEHLKECHEKRLQLEKIARNKKLRKLSLMAIFVIAVVGFFMSPAWEELKNRVMPEKMEDPRVVQTEKKEEKKEKITIKNAKPGDAVIFGAKEWYVLETDEKKTKMILLQGQDSVQEDLEGSLSEEEQNNVVWEESYYCPVICISKE